MNFIIDEIEIKNLDHLEINAGEIIIMTGPSGSGKTTLLTLCGGLRSAQSGSLKVLGTELCGASAKQLTIERRHHGYIGSPVLMGEAIACLNNRSVRVACRRHSGDYLNKQANNFSFIKSKFLNP